MTNPEPSSDSPAQDAVHRAVAGVQARLRLAEAKRALLRAQAEVSAAELAVMEGSLSDEAAAAEVGPPKLGFQEAIRLIAAVDAEGRAACDASIARLGELLDKPEAPSANVALIWQGALALLHVNQDPDRLAEYVEQSAAALTLVRRASLESFPPGLPTTAAEPSGPAAASARPDAGHAQ